MAIDASIPLRGIPVEMPNQLAQYAQMQQLMAGQDTQQMNALKMQEAQRALQENNAMRGLNINDPDYRAKVYGISPTRGAAFDVATNEAAGKKATTGKLVQETSDMQQKAADERLSNLRFNPSVANITAHNEDIQLSNATPEAKAYANQRAQMLLGLDDAGRKQFFAELGSTAGNRMTAQTANLDRTSREGTSAAGIEGRASEGVLNRAATAANIQPTAPTVTQIVDPANPNQMIAIDAKRYQGGGAGSPGVIGVSGKEPGAALRINKAEEGKTQLADDLDNLRSAFTELDRMRAIPSTERGSASNIGSAIAASGLGQMTGRAFGTTAQVEREVINSARTRLVNSIKNATGMSAQQLNSNVELQTMLRSIADSGQPLQAAMRIIDDIEKAYVHGSGKISKDKGNSGGGGTGGWGKAVAE